MLVAVVVTYSAPPEELARCLHALRTGGGVDHVLVYDTGGSAVLPQPADGAPVELVRIDNRGYGAAANAGFARAGQLGADWVALLNDDVIVRPGWTAPLLAELTSHPGAGAAQPKIVAPDGTVMSLGVTRDRHGAGIDLGDGSADDGDPSPRPIEIFTGGAVVFRPQFLGDTGGFDARWFLYYEDVDLALRGAAKGWTYRLAPASVVEHARSSSTSAAPARTRYLQERNRLWAAFRHASPATIGQALWLSIRRLRHAPHGVHAKALAAGLAGAPRRLWERRRYRP